MKKLLSILTITLLFSCHNQAQVNPEQKAVIDAEPVAVPLKDGKARAYFASGCFWCVEAIFESVKGVDKSISGYAGGFTENPTYEASNTGKTGHAEAVEIIYDPEIISFYQNDEQKKIIEDKKAALAKELDATIAAEVYPFQKFWVGEDYHQNYERLHPNQGYIRNVSIPRLNKFKAKFPELLKEDEKH
ncbi:peptide-methionine (S)-S-oxide reductase [uncultured Winogradskyella sp.]|uniref:peptide-methionine (S)-S-oxide reductase n=1 Tax=uncultured Winogradskyella sp. TaxID=395353 RepID=UPI0030EE3CB6